MQIKTLQDQGTGRAMGKAEIVPAISDSVFVSDPFDSSFL
jgi:hypothetical protein